MSFFKHTLTALCLVFSFVIHCAPPVSWQPNTLFVLPESGRACWLDAIQHAQKDIKMTAYKLSDLQIIDALSQAQQRGVSVSLIVESDVFHHEQSFNETTPMAILKKQGIHVYERQKNQPQAHSKFIIIDESWGLISTGNLDAESFDGIQEQSIPPARDFAFPVFDINEVQEMLSVFNGDIKNQEVYMPLTASSLVWGPKDQLDFFLEMIGRAKHSIHIYQQDIQDKRIMAALLEGLKRGISVQLIMTPYPFYKTVDHNHSHQTLLKENGATVHLVTDPYIHAKALLIDAHDLYLGSCNFYPASLDHNREIGKHITNRVQIEAFLSAFKQDLER